MSTEVSVNSPKHSAGQEDERSSTRCKTDRNKKNKTAEHIAIQRGAVYNRQSEVQTNKKQAMVSARIIRSSIWEALPLPIFGVFVLVLVWELIRSRKRR
ncbi:hypothetical protein AAE478_005753 [Parahypoxylon ruwenzoriense]